MSVPRSASPSNWQCKSQSSARPMPNPGSLIDAQLGPSSALHPAAIVQRRSSLSMASADVAVELPMHFSLGGVRFSGLARLLPAHESLVHVLTEDLKISAQWQCPGPVDLFHVLQVACGGPVLSLHPRPDEDSRDFIEEYQTLVKDGRTTLVAELDSTRQLILAPVPGTEDAPTFWGYVAAPHAPTFVSKLLASGQIAVILDLDETLLLANTAQSLDTAISRRETELRPALEARLAKAETEEDRDAITREIEALNLELKVMRKDRDLLGQFAAPNNTRRSITIDNGPGIYTPKWEAVTFQGVPRQRPVLRLHGGSVILTQIYPDDPQSSMIFRIRPEWADLRKCLASVSNNSKRRFKVYVCTAAEREYALEAWRLLDPQGEVIQSKKVQGRIVNVAELRNNANGPGRKTLMQALGLVPNMTSGMNVSSMARDATSISPGYLLPPLAVVVDDRTDVWADPDSGHVLKVVPWQPYRDGGARQAKHNVWTQAVSEKELVRVRNAIERIRGDVYQTIDKRLRPEVDAVLQQGPHTDIVELGQKIRPWMSVPRVLQNPEWQRFFGMRELVGPPTQEAAAATIATDQPAYAPPVEAPIARTTASAGTHKDSKARPSTVPPASSAPGAASKPATQQRPPDRPLEKKNTVDIKNMADWDLSALPDDDASEEAAPSGQRRDSSDPEERSAPTSAPAEDPSGVPSTSGRAELSDPLANAIITLLRIPRNVELTLNLICTQLQVGKAHMAQPLALLAGALKHDPSLLEDAVLLRDVCESNLHLADKLTLALSAKQPDKASTLSCVEVFAQAVRKNQGGASATSSVTSVGAAAAAEVPARGATKRSHEQEESSTANKRSRA